MNYTWYTVINKPEFEATGLVSREVSIFLTGIGLKTFLVTRGNLFSITVDDVMLSIGITTANPFVFGNRAVYLDAIGDVWYGVPVA